MSATARTTGWAAIAYAVVYVLTFVTNIVISMVGPASSVRYRTPEQMVADRLFGDIGALGFALLGTTLIIIAIGLRRLIWSDDSVTGAAASSVGVIAGAGLMLAGAAIAAQHGFAPNDLAPSGADAATQLAIVQGGYLLTGAATFLACIGLLVWLSWVAIAARRERVFSTPLIAATWLAALAPIASVALTSFPFGLLVTIPYAAGLGISLLRRARRMDATDAASIARAAMPA
jgi:hypothetical protein